MQLSEFLEKEKRKKFLEILNRINARINKAKRSEEDDAIEYNKKQIHQEKQKLFSNNSDPNEYYHWIEKFASEISLLKGGPYSFEEKVELSKVNLLKYYEGHDYLPKALLFTNQSNEDIILKLAHYYAYEDIMAMFSLDICLIKEKLNKKTSTNYITQKDGSSQNKVNTLTSEIISNSEQEKMFTSIKQIADIFKCSLPTAQKIKNSIPKAMYRQIGKTFAIPSSLLLSASEDLNNLKYGHSN